MADGRAATFTTKGQKFFRRNLHGMGAFGACMALSFALILNLQMGGEGVWFWYANAFRHGARLYADLHLPLQPLFVLETSAWQRILANRCWMYQIPSIIHAAMLFAAIAFVARASRWPSAAKFLLIFGSFLLTVLGNSYRLDDYHVLSESAIFAGIGFLLLGTEVRSPRGRFACAACVGLVSGLSFATRLNDGAVMVATATFCCFVLAREKKMFFACTTLFVALITVAVIVKSTGDSAHDYVANSIFRAVGAKGGGGGFLADPVRMFWKTIKQSVLVWRVWIAVLLTLFVTRWATVKLNRGPVFLTVSRLTLLLGALVLCTAHFRDAMLRGRLVNFFLLLCIFSVYVVGVAVVVRFARSHTQGISWDAREILFLLPLAEWASSSASSAADPLTQYYAPNAMFLLLVAVMLPYQKLLPGVRREVTSWSVVLLVVMVIGKVWVPYQWQFWSYPPMFTHRTWFQHPAYGPLYIDDDLLRFSLASCSDIDEGKPLGSVQPSLLSLPYPYPNYFCATPPWHGYIQTYFDTTQRSTIEKLMLELQSAPPEWIIYQRQLAILTGAEKLYGNGRPLAQRQLDELIFRMLGSGKWKLVERRDYLAGDGWFIIRTRP